MKCRIRFTETAKQDLSDIAVCAAEQSGDKETAKKLVAELGESRRVL